MKPDRDTLLETLHKALQLADDARLRATLLELRPADIADDFHSLGSEDRSRVLFALPSHTMAEVVVMLDEALRGEVVDDLDTESLTEIVSELPPDDAADVLGEMTDEESDEILDQMADEKSEKIERLLEYEEETAGGIMTPDVVAIPIDLTVGDAVRYVREATTDEDLHDVYIVDGDRQLIGTVPLRRLVTNPKSTGLGDICDRNPVSVFAGDDQETVLQVIRKYDVLEAAVVDADDRLLGRITHDDLQDVAEEEAAEDLFRMAGTDAAELERHSILHAARVRLTWLLPCMIGMMMSATVLGFAKPEFDPTLFLALVLFVPMIGAMGGNSGIQISTMIVRGFAVDEPGSNRWSRALLREGRIATAMAPVCGLIAWGLVYVTLPLFQKLEHTTVGLPSSERVAIAVGCAMTIAILLAGILGISLPYTFRRLGVDPAIASGPLVTTLNDVVSVSVYMILAFLIAT